MSAPATSTGCHVLTFSSDAINWPTCLRAAALQGWFHRRRAGPRRRIRLGWLRRQRRHIRGKQRGGGDLDGDRRRHGRRCRRRGGAGGSAGDGGDGGGGGGGRGGTMGGSGRAVGARAPVEPSVSGEALRVPVGTAARAAPQEDNRAAPERRRRMAEWMPPGEQPPMRAVGWTAASAGLVAAAPVLAARARTIRARPTAVPARSCRSAIRSPTASNHRTTLATARSSSN